MPWKWLTPFLILMALIQKGWGFLQGPRTEHRHRFMILWRFAVLAWVAVVMLWCMMPMLHRSVAARTVLVLATLVGIVILVLYISEKVHRTRHPQHRFRAHAS